MDWGRFRDYSKADGASYLQVPAYGFRCHSLLRPSEYYINVDIKIPPLGFCHLESSD